MSRSRHRYPVQAFCSSGTMKLWKRGANKKLRTRAKQALALCEDWDKLLIPHRNEVDNIWNSAKDGKYYVNWHKPDDDECLREWAMHEGLMWSWRLYRWVKVDTLDENNHIIGRHRKNWTYSECSCISNKNCWYWRSFRK